MTKPPSSVLVIIVSRIGDTLLTTPTIRAIHQQWPNAEITVAAHPNRRSLFENIYYISKVLSIEKKRASILSALTRKKWDIALVYGNDKALLRFAVKNCKQTIAFQQEDGFLLGKYTPVKKPDEQMHAIHERALLLSPLNVPLTNYDLEFQPRKSEIDTVRATFGLKEDDGLLLGILPASFPTKSYRDWPEDNFISLGHHLLEKFSGSRLMILGGKTSKAAAARIQKRLGNRAINVTGKLSLRSSAALISILDLYIGVDSGPTHIAGALQTPMIAMYHCMHPGKNLKPYNHPRGIFIEHPHDQSTCSHLTPMSEIHLNTIISSAESLLSNKSSPDASSTY